MLLRGLHLENYLSGIAEESHRSNDTSSRPQFYQMPFFVNVVGGDQERELLVWRHSSRDVNGLTVGNGNDTVVNAGTDECSNNERAQNINYVFHGLVSLLP